MLAAVAVAGLTLLAFGIAAGNATVQSTGFYLFGMAVGWWGGWRVASRAALRMFRRYMDDRRDAALAMRRKLIDEIKEQFGEAHANEIVQEVQARLNAEMRGK